MPTAHGGLDSGFRRKERKQRAHSNCCATFGRAFILLSAGNTKLKQAADGGINAATRRHFLIASTVTMSAPAMTPVLLTVATPLFIFA